MRKKIIFSPSFKIAEYWCHQMGLSRGEVKVITPHGPIQGYRGIKPEDVYAYLFEEPFDYPEDTDPYFVSFCMKVEEYLRAKGADV